MSFVIQQPRSLTNPSDSYRVVEFRPWANYADELVHHLPVKAEASTFADAERICNELNQNPPEGSLTS